MDKKIDRLKLETLIVTLIEIIGIGIFTTCYLLNVGGIKDTLKVEYVAIIYIVLLFLDCIYIFRVLFSVNKIRKKSDLRTEQLLGNDINEAYQTAKMGLAVTDKEGVVLWESDYLYQQGIDIVNQNIFEWNEKFQDFLKKENDYKLTFEINNQTYSVKYLRTSGIFIFVETTDYEQLRKYSLEQDTCIGIITIDNYSEIVGSNEDMNDLVTRAKTIIFDYGKKYDLLLKSVRNDTLFVVCNYKNLQAMCKDQFSILEKVKEAGDTEHLTPTLSIGFAYDFPDVNKLNEMAANNIELAISRGGDQAVVTKYAGDTFYYGGKSENTSKRSTVHIRAIGDAIVGLIEKSSNVLIMGHQDMDLDALGAALGMYEICISYRKPAFIVYEPNLTEKKTRVALTTKYEKDDLSKMVVSTKEALDLLKSTTLVIVVDVNVPKMTMCPELLERTKKTIVIDHHRKNADAFIEDAVLTHIDPSASSACELIAEMLKFSPRMQEAKIDQLVATFMLSGIFLDTGFFKNKNVGFRAFEACGYLKDMGADNTVADGFLKDDYEEYIFINKILGTMKTPYLGVVYCVVDDDEIVERTILAKVANQCINLKGIKAAFVIGRTAGDEVRISARSDGSVNVQVLCERLGGGGHFSSSACSFKSITVKEVEEKLLDVLESHLSEASNSTKQKENN